jgi:hypothetical protein
MTAATQDAPGREPSMPRSQSLLIILGTVLLASACARAEDSPVKNSPSILSQAQNGIEVQLVAVYRDQEHLWATLCYEQPSGQNWIPGWHPDDASITVAGDSYPMSSLELIGFQSSQDGLVTHRCDRFEFFVPERPKTEAYSLTIERLMGKRATSPIVPRCSADLTRTMPVSRSNVYLMQRASSPTACLNDLMT